MCLVIKHCPNSCDWLTLGKYLKLFLWTLTARMHMPVYQSYTYTDTHTHTDTHTSINGYAQMRPYSSGRNFLLLACKSIVNLLIQSLCHISFEEGMWMLVVK